MCRTNGFYKNLWVRQNDNIAYSNGSIPLLGDVDFDGDVDASDALLVLRYVLGLVSFDDNTLAIADVNNDGAADSLDVIIILRLAFAVC